MAMPRTSSGTRAHRRRARVVGSSIATACLVAAVAVTGSHGAIAAALYCLALVAASVVAGSDSRAPGDWRGTDGWTDGW